MKTKCQNRWSGRQNSIPGKTEVTIRYDIDRGRLVDRIKQAEKVSVEFASYHVRRPEI